MVFKKIIISFICIIVAISLLFGGYVICLYKTEDGKSAYELAVENGFRGSVEEWLYSLIGYNGKDGLDGLRGYSFWLYNTPSNVPIVDFRNAFPLAQIGDYIVNTSSNQRTIFGMNVLIGGVVQITGYTTGILEGNIRGPQGPIGPPAGGE